MEYDQTLAAEAFALAARWIKAIGDGVDGAFAASDMQGWNANQVVVFLERLHAGPRVPLSYAARLDETYSLSTAQNPEVRLRFYEVALEEQGGRYAEEAAAWVASQGRMKYCRTIFKALYRVDPALAQRTFLENESFYHPIAAAMIRKVRIRSTPTTTGPRLVV